MIGRERLIGLFLIAASLLLIVVFYTIQTPPPTAAQQSTAWIPTKLNRVPVPATHNDLFLPGTQPNQLDDGITPPDSCRACHSGYSARVDQPAEYEPWTGWQGSMMAQAGRDPVFYAALDIANADVEGGGEFCLRCHLPRGWLNGRSTPTDASAMTADDLEGVQCEVCHRMVNPTHMPGVSPERDQQILADIAPPLMRIGSGAIIIDPEDYRRGPYDVVADWDNFDPHLANGAKGTLQAAYHQEAQFCGACHDIDNPLLSWDEATQSYRLNELDTPAPDQDELFPIERTYSEWAASAFNSPEGVYAPQFGGNKTHVSTCQDCHMRDVTGVGGTFFSARLGPERDDLPVHDLTGANTWVPQTLPLHPEFGETFTSEPARLSALEAGVERARLMLQNAASLHAVRQGNQLMVTVINKSGHKLPTGYVEGRRMWIQVEGYNESGELIFSSGAYDVETAVLDGYKTDPTLKVYESHHGLSEEWAQELGLPAGPSFHFMLNNMIASDNRIPPQGYSYDAFAAVGAAPYSDGQPDPTMYADGQYWDTTTYTLPDGVVSGTVRLLHQVASREYIEFLRDNNPNAADPNNNGQILFDLWELTERSKPEIMQEVPISDDLAFLPLVVR